MRNTSDSKTAFDIFAIRADTLRKLKKNISAGADIAGREDTTEGGLQQWTVSSWLLVDLLQTEARPRPSV